MILPPFIMALLSIHKSLSTAVAQKEYSDSVAIEHQLIQ